VDIDQVKEFVEDLKQDSRFAQVLLEIDQWHGVQMYGWSPYVYHLAHVAMLGVEYGFDTPAWIYSFLLHDSLEDTDLEPGELENLYGKQVAKTVVAVTGTNGSRAEHCAAQYAKIKAWPPAAIVKAMDRLSHYINLADSYDENPTKYARLAAMYESEADEFEAQLGPLLPPVLLLDLQEARAIMVQNCTSVAA
jgi:(p)ppGpp synthase/HD superfamily hydrolase